MDNSETIEINTLKKYNIKMTILKIIAVLLVILILVMCAIFISGYTKRKKCEYIAEIMSEAYSTLESIEASGNYTLIDDYTVFSSGVHSGNQGTSRTTTFHKDGYFKEVVINNGNHFYTNYGTATENETYYVQFDKNLDFTGGISIRIQRIQGKYA